MGIGHSYGNPFYPLSHLGLGRAYALIGDLPKARKSYENSFTIWKDADPGIPILVQAKKEYAKTSSKLSHDTAIEQWHDDAPPGAKPAAAKTTRGIRQRRIQLLCAIPQKILPQKVFRKSVFGKKVGFFTARTTV